MEGEFIQMENQQHSRWFSGWFKWCPTSDALLQAAEARILEKLNVPHKGRYVITTKQHKIWTVSFNPDGKGTPILMVHGFGAGLGMWALNVRDLSKDRPVHTFDLLGFARSSRPTFDHDPDVVEATFINSIEDTRKELGLNKFVLLGHSFGAYLACAYTIKHPEHVKSLILADPWGFSEKPADWEKTVSIPTWVKVIVTILRPFNPFSGMRFAGPFGPSMVRRFRGDLQEKFSSIFDDDTILNYIYHCNAQTPSGESGFKRLVLPYGWAKNPMIHRMKDIRSHIKVTMLFGSDSWINNSMAKEMGYERPEQFSVHVLQSAGHHVYADRRTKFNSIVREVCDTCDEDNSLSKLFL